MPRGDGTGPPGGSGPGTGRGGGRGKGVGTGGRGMGRMRGNRPGAGSGGNCVCPQCGAKIPHQVGVPCYSVNCPTCSTAMVRE